MLVRDMLFANDLFAMTCCGLFAHREEVWQRLMTLFVTTARNFGLNVSLTEVQQVAG